MSIATLYSAGRIRVYCRVVDEDGESVNIGRWIQNQIKNGEMENYLIAITKC